MPWPYQRACHWLAMDAGQRCCCCWCNFETCNLMCDDSSLWTRLTFKKFFFNPNSYLSFLQSIKCYFRSVDHFLLPCRVFLISKMMNFKEFLSGLAPAPAVHLHHAPLFRGIALQLSQSSGNKRPLRPRSIKSRNFIYKLQRLDVSI